jgi:hypothetical protein
MLVVVRGAAWHWCCAPIFILASSSRFLARPRMRRGACGVGLAIRLKRSSFVATGHKLFFNWVSRSISKSSIAMPFLQPPCNSRGGSPHSSPQPTKTISNFKSTKAYFPNADVKPPRGPTRRAHNNYRKSCASTYHATSIEKDQ